MSDEPETPDAVPAVPDEERISALVGRLARPHRSGGRVVERASLLAAGPDFGAAVAWIEAHGGEPELPAAVPVRRGLHSARLSAGPTAAAVTPLRFILPTAAVTRTP